MQYSRPAALAGRQRRVCQAPSRRHYTVWKFFAMQGRRLATVEGQQLDCADVHIGARAAAGHDTPDTHPLLGGRRGAGRIPRRYHWPSRWHAIQALSCGVRLRVAFLWRPIIRPGRGGIILPRRGDGARWDSCCMARDIWRPRGAARGVHAAFTSRISDSAATTPRGAGSGDLATAGPYLIIFFFSTSERRPSGTCAEEAGGEKDGATARDR